MNTCKTPCTRTQMPAAGRLSRWLVIVLLAVMVSACTNSKLIIAPLYNRLDDRMRDQFNELADFSDEQTAAFEASLGTFHVWHRQSELPQYAAFIKTLAASVKTQNTTADDIQQWMDTVELHSRKARDCHPVNFSIDLMKSLTEEQLASIEQNYNEERQEDIERYESRTAEERVERRLRNISKWAGRIDVDLTPTQRAMLLSAFKQQISLRKEYFSLSEKWYRELFELVRANDNPDFDEDMRAHLAAQWRQLESEYPEQWQANSELWKNTGLRFVQSLTTEQRTTINQWLTRFSATLDAIAKDKPSFQVVNDPSVGCLVNPGKS
ncbi:MAG: DUF6279 family lipoprotein [Granulosicoccus sp.]